MEADTRAESGRWAHRDKEDDRSGLGEVRGAKQGKKNDKAVVQKKGGVLMNIDDILKQYPYIAEDIQREQAELNKFIQLQQEARNPLRVHAFDGMPHNPGVSDKTYQAVEKIIDEYQTEIDACVEAIRDLLDTKRWMDLAYTRLTEDERRVLLLRYDKNIGIRNTAITMRRGYETVKKLTESAKEKINKTMNT